MNKKILFVTTGATLPFLELIEGVLSKDFLKSVKKHNFTHLRIQYGNENGAKVFKNGLKNLLDSNKDNGNEYWYENICITGYTLTNKIDEEIKNSAVVISHAGTGSILDTLRLKKKLIIVPNTKLMDNHQLQVALELAKKNYLICCESPNSFYLSEALNTATDFTFTEFPLPKMNFVDIIDIEAGIKTSTT